MESPRRLTSWRWICQVLLFKRWKKKMRGDQESSSSIIIEYSRSRMKFRGLKQKGKVKSSVQIFDLCQRRRKSENFLLWKQWRFCWREVKNASSKGKKVSLVLNICSPVEGNFAFSDVWKFFSVKLSNLDSFFLEFVKSSLLFLGIWLGT